MNLHKAAEIQHKTTLQKFYISSYIESTGCFMVIDIYGFGGFIYVADLDFNDWNFYERTLLNP